MTVEQVIVPLGQRATLSPITLSLGGVREAVEVIGSSPTVDTSSSSTGANLQSDFLERLPTQRHVSDVVQLAAGVADSGGAGEANPSISGASGLENQYIIDGVNVTNSGYGAGRAVTYRGRRDNQRRRRNQTSPPGPQRVIELSAIALLPIDFVAARFTFPDRRCPPRWPRRAGTKPKPWLRAHPLRRPQGDKTPRAQCRQFRRTALVQTH